MKSEPIIFKSLHISISALNIYIFKKYHAYESYKFSGNNCRPQHNPRHCAMTKGDICVQNTYDWY